VAERDISMEGSNRFSTLMEAYSSIRAAVDFSLPRTSNVIQLTSSQAGEGKSTTAVILAEMFASFGRKTLLVDADLRRPSVAGLLGIERPKVGVVEVVLGHVELDDAVVKGVHENLEILPVGEIPPNPSEILASKEFRQFIERCRAEYSLVIFDSCPVMGIADAPMLGRLVDATIFVLEANTLPFSRARASVRRLNAAGAKTIGAVLTKYRALEAGQSYDYQYSYYSYGGDRE
jgi:capsular exopolysaccharide synthesis family protein